MIKTNQRVAEPISLRLNEAATLHHMPTDRFKTARWSIYTLLPAHAERSPLITLLFGILRRGSEHYPRLALLNRRLDELYGTTLTIRNELYGDTHVVCYTAEMLEQAFLPAADADMDILGGVTALLSDMLLHPLCDGNGLLRAEAVEREKQSLCDSLLSLRNDTRAYAAARLRSLMCADEPHGLSIGGTVERVRAITPAEVTACYRDLMKHARCEVFYTGRAEVGTVVRAWENAFGDWHPDRAPLPPTAVHVPPAVPRRVEEDMAVSQGKLCMGWACGQGYGTGCDPRTMAAYAVCNELFGVMQNSLLFRRVREELGLCYYCDSALDMTKGILRVSCGMHPAHRAEAEAAINGQLAAIREGQIDPADVELAKLSLLNGYRQMEDSQGAMEDFAFARLMNGTTESLSEVMAHIRAVTAEEVTAVAGTYKPDTVFFLNGTAAGEGGEEDDGDDEDR